MQVLIPVCLLLESFFFLFKFIVMLHCFQTRKVKNNAEARKLEDSTIIRMVRRHRSRFTTTSDTNTHKKRINSLDMHAGVELVARRARRKSGYDALLFVQGFNTSAEHSMSLLGQLLALGSFPGDIAPVVFAWPCTTILWYLMVRHACTSCITTSCMLKFLWLLNVLFKPER